MCYGLDVTLIAPAKRDKTSTLCLPLGAGFSWRSFKFTESLRYRENICVCASRQLNRQIDGRCKHPAFAPEAREAFHHADTFRVASFLLPPRQCPCDRPEPLNKINQLVVRVGIGELNVRGESAAAFLTKFGVRKLRVLLQQIP